MLRNTTLNRAVERNVILDCIRYVQICVASTSPKVLYMLFIQLWKPIKKGKVKEEKEDIISYLSLLVSLWLSLGFLPASQALGAFGESWWYL